MGVMARCLGVLALAAVACGPGAEEAGTVEGELVSVLEVQLEDDAVRFVLRVRNTGSEARTLEFATAQRYDFVVRDASGTEVWRWSADQMFAQVLGAETLPAGGALVYEAEWPSGERTGRYEVEGVVPALNHPIEVRETIELGGAGQ